eukprot:2628137-Prymnesium_polylepis.1
MGAGAFPRPTWGGAHTGMGQVARAGRDGASRNLCRELRGSAEPCARCGRSGRPQRARSKKGDPSPVLSFERSHTVHAYCVNTLLEEVFKRLNTSLSRCSNT